MQAAKITARSSWLHLTGKDKGPIAPAFRQVFGPTRDFGNRSATFHIGCPVSGAVLLTRQEMSVEVHMAACRAKVKRCGTHSAPAARTLAALEEPPQNTAHDAPPGGALEFLDQRRSKRPADPIRARHPARTSRAGPAGIAPRGVEFAGLLLLGLCLSRFGRLRRRLGPRGEHLMRRMPVDRGVVFARHRRGDDQRAPGLGVAGAKLRRRRANERTLDN